MVITDGAGYHAYIPNELIGKQILFKGQKRGSEVRGGSGGRIADPFTLEIIGSGAKITLNWAEREERNRAFEQLVPKDDNPQKAKVQVKKKAKK